MRFSRSINSFIVLNSVEMHLLNGFSSSRTLCDVRPLANVVMTSNNRRFSKKRTSPWFRAEATATTVHDGVPSTPFTAGVGSKFTPFERSRTRILDIVSSPGDGSSRVGEKVTIKGWVRTLRDQKQFAFVQVNDGSNVAGLQVLLDPAACKGYEAVTNNEVHTGVSVVVEGELVASPGGQQKVEIKASSFTVTGACDPNTYPLQKKRHTLEFLREQGHLRARTNTIGAVTRVRSTLAFATHEFFTGNGFQYVQTPLISASDCEGAGEMFQVTTLLNRVDAAAGQPPLDPRELDALKAEVSAQGGRVRTAKDAAKVDPALKARVDAELAELTRLKDKLGMVEAAAKSRGLPLLDNGKVDYREDFFGEPAFLTVSGQLNGEIYACAVGDVYTFGPTFRAENSNTNRHLAEFWMIEPEMAFADLRDDMRCAEAYVRHCMRALLERCPEEVAFFDKMYEKGLAQRLQRIAETPFATVTYTEAVDTLLKSGQSFEFPVEWGRDLQSEHERFLTEKVFNGTPLIVTDYPKQCKAFYMRENEDGRTVSAMDVLVPKVGELIGGSQREERLDVLERRIREQGMPLEPYWWYLDLRRFGSIPHAGFGLGFERLVQMSTGIENIRDVIGFPRYPKSCKF